MEAASKPNTPGVAVVLDVPTPGITLWTDFEPYQAPCAGWPRSPLPRRCSKTKRHRHGLRVNHGVCDGRSVT